jgi:hypothetical protein
VIRDDTIVWTSPHIFAIDFGMSTPFAASKVWGPAGGSATLGGIRADASYGTYKYFVAVLITDEDGNQSIVTDDPEVDVEEEDG